MKTCKIFLLLIIPLLLFKPSYVLGENLCPQNACQKIDDLSQKIICLEDIAAKCGKQRVDLISQINYMDNQINLTASRIKQTEKKISQLDSEIASLSGKIGRIEESLGDLSNILLDRISQTYKQGGVQTFHLLLSGGGFSQFLTRLKYLRIVQAHDKKLMIQMQETKDNYTDQKQIREAKKQEQEKLKKQLEAQKITLAQQQKDKQSLLEITRNDEQRYQDLLTQARGELAAVMGQGKEVFLKDVSEGEKIGRVILGPSGCSTGTHLHFEVHKGVNYQDPNNYLKSISFSYNYGQNEYGKYGTINPHGSWNWPLNEPIIITQGFGSHDYAKTAYPYTGGVHIGIDLKSTSNNDVKAVKEGKLYGGSYQCENGPLLYAKIEQGDGITTWYLHMIPQ